MSRVISIVTGRISDDQRGAVIDRYTATVGAGVPPGIERTFLVSGPDGTMSVLTVWRDRRDLEAMRASGEEPFARRLLREAGGDPQGQFLDVLATSD